MYTTILARAQPQLLKGTPTCESAPEIRGQEGEQSEPTTGDLSGLEEGFCQLESGTWKPLGIFARVATDRLQASRMSWAKCAGQLPTGRERVASKQEHATQCT